MKLPRHCPFTGEIAYDVAAIWNHGGWRTAHSG